MKNPTEKKHLFNFVFMRVNTQTNKMCMLCICHVTSGFDCVCVCMCVCTCAFAYVCVSTLIYVLYSERLTLKAWGKWLPR